jgi:Membrane domain of glycerophosphoryl diester phosphodiesterase
VTLAGVLRSALRRYLKVMGFVFLVLVMEILFCAFPLWTWILVNWSAVLPAMFIENLGLGAAMGRSWNMVRGMWWRTFFILFLVGILWYVVTIALGAFFYLGQSLLGAVLSPYLALSIYEGAVILVQGLTVPILLIAIVLVYFDLRVRKEGIDLFQMASRLTASSAAAG